MLPWEKFSETEPKWCVIKSFEVIYVGEKVGGGGAGVSISFLTEVDKDVTVIQPDLRKFTPDHIYKGMFRIFGRGGDGTHFLQGFQGGVQIFCKGGIRFLHTLSFHWSLVMS